MAALPQGEMTDAASVSESAGGEPIRKGDKRKRTRAQGRIMPQLHLAVQEEFQKKYDTSSLPAIAGALHARAILTL